MALIQTSYLQKAWGESIDDVSLSDIRTAIQETIKMDEEHGAFWVSVGDNEDHILETHKDLKVIGIFENNIEIRKQFSNWVEIENLYESFLASNFDEVITVLRS